MNKLVDSDLEQSPQIPQKKSNLQQKLSTKKLLLILLCAVVVIGGVVYYFRPVPTKDASSTVVNKVEKYEEANPSADVSSVSVKDRVVYINDKPAFLFGVYMANDDWAIDALNANVFIDAGLKTTQEKLAQLTKGRAWVLRQAYPGLQFGPPFSNEIGSAWVDEPLDNGITVTSNATTPQDGRLNFQNYPSGFGNLAIGDSEAVAPYLPLVDQLGKNALVTYDLYIQNIGGVVANNPQFSGIGVIYQYMLGVKQALGDKRDTPMGAYIETTQWLKNSLPVTPEIVIGETKAAITGGATMINWWDRMGDVATNSTPSNIAAAIRNFTAEVHTKLAPILLAKQIDGLDSSWTDAIKVGGRMTHNEQGNQVYNIILFNSTDKAINAEKALPNLDKQDVIESVSGKPLAVQRGKIKVTIPAYDWIIASYEVK